MKFVRLYWRDREPLTDIRVAISHTARAVAVCVTIVRKYIDTLGPSKKFSHRCQPDIGFKTLTNLKVTSRVAVTSKCNAFRHFRNIRPMSLQSTIQNIP